jgi:hypothetical protein
LPDDPGISSNDLGCRKKRSGILANDRGSLANDRGILPNDLPDFSKYKMFMQKLAIFRQLHPVWLENPGFAGARQGGDWEERQGTAAIQDDPRGPAIPTAQRVILTNHCFAGASSAPMARSSRARAAA